MEELQSAKVQTAVVTGKFLTVPKSAVSEFGKDWRFNPSAASINHLTTFLATKTADVDKFDQFRVI